MVYKYFYFSILIDRISQSMKAKLMHALSDLDVADIFMINWNLP